MKKRLSLFLIIVLLVGAFGACGSSDTNDTNSNNAVQTPILTSTPEPTLAPIPIPSPTPMLSPEGNALIGRWRPVESVLRPDLVGMRVSFGGVESEEENMRYEEWIEGLIGNLIAIEFFTDGTGVMDTENISSHFPENIYWSVDGNRITIIDALYNFMLQTFSYSMSGSRFTIYNFRWTRSLTFERVN